jgi:hypothetical protein
MQSFQAIPEWVTLEHQVAKILTAQEIHGNEDRRDDFEEPWNWAFPTVLQDPGDYEESGDDIRRRERMAQAMYEC